MRSGVIQGKFVHGGPKVSGVLPHPAVRPAPYHQAFAAAAQPRTAQPQAPRGATLVEPATLHLPAGAGRPLPEAERHHMEAVFGARLGEVRIHEGPQASALGAVAFTLGSEIHFAPGHFVPGTGAGRQLLGHEIAHVLQQRSGRVRNPLGGGLVVLQDPALEAEAERMGLRAAQAIPQGPATSVLPSIGPGAVAGGRMALQPAKVAQLMKRKKPYGNDDWIDYDERPKKKKPEPKKKQIKNQGGGSKSSGLPGQQGFGYPVPQVGNQVLGQPPGNLDYFGHGVVYQQPVFDQFGYFRGYQPVYQFYQPFEPYPVTGPWVQDLSTPKTPKKKRYNTLLSKNELEDLELDAQQGLYQPSPTISPPKYFQAPEWGEYEDFGGGTSVEAVLGPAAEDFSGSLPMQGECSCVEQLNQDGANFSSWVKGHLLNQSMGGPGTSKNLTALTHQANMEFKKFESKLRNAIHWCRQQAARSLTDTYFYGVRFSIEVIGKSFPNPKSRAECEVASHSFCRMSYVKQRKDPPNGPIEELDPKSDPTPNPSPYDLLFASLQTYPCVL